MRLWSLHPKYLDAAGLVALWREGLLAQAVLRGATRGYTRHPQLQRFREASAPVASVAAYLRAVHHEASVRGYRFDASKLARARGIPKLSVTDGQLALEWRHLLRKLRTRSPQRYRELRRITTPAPHPLFEVVAGGTAAWERASHPRIRTR